MWLILFFRRLFVKKPNRPLRWSVEDFEWGKKWAMSQPHPFSKRKTLWDFIYSPRYDSVEVLHEINKRII
jgi:hypothetical protein